MLYGVRQLPPGRRKIVLEALVFPIFDRDFVGRILPFDSSAAAAYSYIVAARRFAGRPISQFDAQIAAIAVSRGAAIATRNVADFADVGTTIINPWDRAG